MLVSCDLQRSTSSTCEPIKPREERAFVIQPGPRCKGRDPALPNFWDYILTPILFDITKFIMVTHVVQERVSINEPRSPTEGLPTFETLSLFKLRPYFPVDQGRRSWGWGS